MVGRAKNPKQQKISHEYLQYCKHVYIFILRRGEALNPLDPLYNRKCRDPKYSMDKKCAAMYVEESINCSYFKSGSTGNARQRKEYRKQFWEKQGLVAPAINFVVNIDSLSTETQTEVSKIVRAHV